jgi:uncharacterized protein (DUF697 family)
LKKSPVKIRDILNVVKQIKEEADNKLNIFIMGENGVGKKTLKSYFEQERKDSGILKILDLLNDYKFNKESDFVLFLHDVNKDLNENVVLFLNRIAKNKIRFMVVLNKIDICSNLEDRLKYVLKSLSINPNEIISVSLSGGINVEDKLIPEILRSNKASSIFLAGKLPVFRDSAAESIINQTALVNSLIGGVSLIPGSDMPLLTFNQIKMVLRIAALFGEELSVDRATEIIATIGGGLIFRGIARQLLGLIPGPGWIIKGGVAYSGTVALGKAAVSYLKGFKDSRIQGVK